MQIAIACLSDYRGNYVVNAVTCGASVGTHFNVRFGVQEHFASKNAVIQSPFNKSDAESSLCVVERKEI